MNEYKIEKGIPMPPIPKKYPFNLMEIGDSFFVPKPPNKVSAVAGLYGKRHGKKFRCITVDGGTRVFRVL